MGVFKIISVSRRSAFIFNSEHVLAMFAVHVTSIFFDRIGQPQKNADFCKDIDREDHYTRR